MENANKTTAFNGEDLVSSLFPKHNLHFAALSVLFTHLVAYGETIEDRYETHYFDVKTIDDLAVCLYRNQDISFDDIIDIIAQMPSDNLMVFYKPVGKSD